MKLSELRQMIREEIVGVINEVTISASDKANYSPKFITDVERLYFLLKVVLDKCYTTLGVWTNFGHDLLYTKLMMNGIN